ncbi:MAG: hypothetical protein AAF676_12275 [Pseudomonadota bacterium]
MSPTLHTLRLTLRLTCAEYAGVWRAFFADAEASAYCGGPLPAQAAWSCVGDRLGFAKVWGEKFQDGGVARDVLRRSLTDEAAA